MDRRSVIKGCAEFMLANSFGSDYFLSDKGKRETLVVVFLRGGMDGLNFLAPVDDKNYRDVRGGGLALTESDIKVDQNLAQYDFRLHSSASALKELYDDKSLAFVHAAGLTNGTRSHFQAQDLMEMGSSNDKSVSEGWLARYVKSFQSGDIIPAYAMGSSSPASLLGSMNKMNLREFSDLNLDYNQTYLSVLSKMYSEGSSIVHQSGSNALSNIKHIKATLEAGGDAATATASNADYLTEWPGEDLSRSFKSIAKLIKMDVGLRVATVDFDGWDMHDGQNWQFPKYTEALSRNLKAFYNDIHASHKRVTVVLMTEFGRRLKANNNGGTDHGHGGVMMVLGGNVKGGNMYGQWPGLDNSQLDNGVDLAVTTDYRSVLSEILESRKLIDSSESIFPGYKSSQNLGLIK